MGDGGRLDISLSGYQTGQPIVLMIRLEQQHMQEARGCNRYLYCKIKQSAVNERGSTVPMKGGESHEHRCWTSCINSKTSTHSYQSSHIKVRFPGGLTHISFPPSHHAEINCCDPEVGLLNTVHCCLSHDIIMLVYDRFKGIFVLRCSHQLSSSINKWEKMLGFF